MLHIKITEFKIDEYFELSFVISLDNYEVTFPVSMYKINDHMTIHTQNNIISSKNIFKITINKGSYEFTKKILKISIGYYDRLLININSSSKITRTLYSVLNKINKTVLDNFDVIFYDEEIFVEILSGIVDSI
jgi:hypothetical protein